MVERLTKPPSSDQETGGITLRVEIKGVKQIIPVPAPLLRYFCCDVAGCNIAGLDGHASDDVWAVEDISQDVYEVFIQFAHFGVGFSDSRVSMYQRQNKNVTKLAIEVCHFAKRRNVNALYNQGIKVMAGLNNLDLDLATAHISFYDASPLRDYFTMRLALNVLNAAPKPGQPTPRSPATEDSSEGSEDSFPYSFSSFDSSKSSLISPTYSWSGSYHEQFVKLRQYNAGKVVGIDVFEPIPIEEYLLEAEHRTIEDVIRKESQASLVISRLHQYLPAVS